MTMRSNEQGSIQSSPNDGSGDTQVVSHQLAGDFVVNSSASAGAWISATHPMLNVDQIDTEVA